MTLRALLYDNKSELSSIFWNVILEWWQGLDDDRGTRARLRRAKTPDEVFVSPDFQRGLRTLLAAGTAMAFGFLIGPWLIHQLRRLKFGQHYDDDRTGDLAQRFDKKNTPTMGGLLIFGSVFASVALWAQPNVWVLVAMFVYTALTAVGFRDDYLKAVKRNRDGISSREKMMWQTLITLVALAVLVLHPMSAVKIRELWVPFFKSPVLVFAGGFGLVALFVMMFFWVVGFSNAINLNWCKCSILNTFRISTNQ